MKNKKDEPEFMTLEGARRVIRKRTATYAERYVAGLMLCLNKRTTYADLLACLKQRGADFRAARKLHTRTRRPQLDGKDVLAPKNWHRYLKAKGLLRKPKKRIRSSPPPIGGKSL
jgi:hypothetical protein